MNKNYNRTFLLFLGVILLALTHFSNVRAQCSPPDCWPPLSGPLWGCDGCDAWWKWAPCRCMDACDGVTFAPKLAYQCLHTVGSAASLEKATGIREKKNICGALYGIEGAYYYKSCCNLIATGWASYAGGMLDNCRAKSIRAYDFDCEATLGYYLDYTVLYSTYVIPYFGIGYTFNRLDYKQETRQDKRLRKRYHILYVPVGLRWGWRVTPGLDIQLHVKVMPQVDSTLKINPISHARLHLAKGVSYLVEIPFIWNLPCYCNYFWRIEFTPYWQQIYYGKSSKDECSGKQFHIPQQNYSFWGVKILAGTLF